MTEELEIGRRWGLGWGCKIIVCEMQPRMVGKSRVERVIKMPNVDAGLNYSSNKKWLELVSY